jgi:hypothetical protein
MGASCEWQVTGDQGIGQRACLYLGQTLECRRAERKVS